MAWRRPGDKPLSEPMMIRLLTHICVIRPQWVKKNKAVEVDHISGEIIISSTQVLLPVYQKLFNSILNGAYYPEVWKKGIVVNLVKTGDPYNPDNCRGLTINSCLGKVFNTIINNRLTNFWWTTIKSPRNKLDLKRRHVQVTIYLLWMYCCRSTPNWKKIIPVFRWFQESIWQCMA